jgi:hypothetical protein
MLNDIPALCAKVDAVLLLSVDGRKHLPQAREIVAAKKPMFIDKPFASTLADAREIARIARQAGVPWFSSSSVRFSDLTEKLKSPANLGVITWGPSPFEEHHQLDLSWYGIHAIEALFTIMGTGCEEVTRVASKDADEVTCRWKDGRLGSVRLLRPSAQYGGVAFRKDGPIAIPATKSGYEGLVREIVKFFETKQAPVSEAETLEIFAFMDAAQRSKEAGGRPFKLQ